MCLVGSDEVSLESLVGGELLSASSKGDILWGMIVLETFGRFLFGRSGDVAG